jgi:outer membrane immunogenic protein
MKKLLAASAALAALIAAPALAADMAVKAPPPPPAVTYYDWTGFYLGANAGYSIGRDPTTVSAISGITVVDNEKFGLSPTGWLAGGQLGYNWQIHNLVLGVEADWQWTNQKDSACVLDCILQFSLNETQKLDSFGTARLRAGYAADHWLWYMTGGAAWGRLSDSRFLQQNATFVIPPVSTAGSASSAFWRGGWVIGAGVETALAGNWTAKLEYLYMDLGHTTDTFTVILPGFLGPPFPFTTTTSSQIRDNIIRAGLNYRFGPSNIDPAAASGGGYYKAPPLAVAAAHNWSGFYAGANAGYSVGRDPSSETDLGLAGIAPPILSNDSFKLSPQDGLIGGQLGYNWQSGNIVLGAEADWQWAHQSDSACVEGCTLSTGGQSLTVSQSMDWFATARGRAGYAFDSWLWYVTGGAAWAREHSSIAFNDGIDVGSASSNQTKAGWVAGTGIETALVGNWSAKFEYLYMDLGSMAESFTLPLANGFVVLNFTGRTELRDNIFRAGLNYKFDGSVVARN